MVVAIKRISFFRSLLGTTVMAISRLLSSEGGWKVFFHQRNRDISKVRPLLTQHFSSSYLSQVSTWGSQFSLVSVDTSTPRERYIFW